MARSRRFQTVPLNTTGGSYRHRSVPISSQRTYNLYPEATPEGMTPSALLKFPGWSVFIPNFTGAPCRALYFWKNKLYAVKDNQLYSMNADNTETAHGTVFGPASVYSISDNGTVMVIATGGTMYQFDGTTLSTVPSVTWNPTIVRFLNERFLTNGDDGGTYASDVLSTNFDVANVFYTRSSTDDAVCPFIFNQIVYGFDKRSIEPWEEASGAPPYARMNGAIVESVGAASPFGITSSDQYIYFIGSDAIAYRMSSFSAEPISNPVISSHFKSLQFDQVKADSFIWDGHRFILFTFFNDDQSWIFSETVGEWFEIGGPGGTRSLAFNLIPAWNGDIYGADYENASIWKLRENWWLHGAEYMEHSRTLSVVSGDDFGNPQATLEMSKLILNVETGGAVDPNDSPITHDAFPKPRLMIEASFDGGYTFQSRPTYIDLGSLGDFTKPIEVHMMRQFKRAVFRLKITDPLERFSIYSAAIDVREAGV